MRKSEENNQCVPADWTIGSSTKIRSWLLWRTHQVESGVLVLPPNFYSTSVIFVILIKSCRARSHVEEDEGTKHFVLHRGDTLLKMI